MYKPEDFRTQKAKFIEDHIAKIDQRLKENFDGTDKKDMTYEIKISKAYASGTKEKEQFPEIETWIQEIVQGYEQAGWIVEKFATPTDAITTSMDRRFMKYNDGFANAVITLQFKNSV